MKNNLLLGVLVGLTLVGSAASGKEPVVPRSFIGLSFDESIYSCTQFFIKSIDLQLSVLHERPNTLSLQNSLRSFVKMKTNTLMYINVEVADDRREAAKAVIGDDVTVEANDVIQYCVAMSNTSQEKMTPKVRKLANDYAKAEADKLLRSAGSIK